MGRGKSGSVGTKNAPKKKSQTKDETEEQKLDRVFAELESKSPGGMVKVYDLQQKFPNLTRKEFVNLVNNGRRAGKYTADSAEGGHVKLSDAERNAGLPSYDDKPLPYLSRRS